MFGKAIDITRRQNAKSWELRATTSLARPSTPHRPSRKAGREAGRGPAPTRRAITFKAQGFRHPGIISLPGFSSQWCLTTCEEIHRGSRPLIKEKPALGISDFVTSTRVYGFADKPGPPRPFLQLAGVNQNGSYQRGLPAIVYPSVIRSPLHNHIERLQLHLTAIQEQRDFA
jgi:hypothetical protein